MGSKLPLDIRSRSVLMVLGLATSILIKKGMGSKLPLGTWPRSILVVSGLATSILIKNARKVVQCRAQEKLIIILKYKSKSFWKQMKQTSNMFRIRKFSFLLFEACSISFHLLPYEFIWAWLYVLSFSWFLAIRLFSMISFICFSACSYSFILV